MTTPNEVQQPVVEPRAMAPAAGKWRKLYNGDWGVVLFDNAKHATGDYVVVEDRSGVRKSVALGTLVTSGDKFALWSVLSDAEVRKRGMVRAVPPVAPVVRRNGVVSHQLPQQPPASPDLPEPPPHTDADAPPPVESLCWPSGEKPGARPWREGRRPRVRYDEHGFLGTDLDDDDGELYDIIHGDIGAK